MGFSVVALDTALKLTGLTSQQLYAVPGVERMTRIQDGAEEEAVRIPAEVLEAAGQSQAAVADALADYRNGGSDAELRARIREIIDAGEPAA